VTPTNRSRPVKVRTRTVAEIRASVMAHNAVMTLVVIAAPIVTRREAVP
jgi:hypothetical protein